MSKCINVKHPDFLQLRGASNLPSIVLEMKVAKWQEDNNTDEFPSLEDLNIKGEQIQYQLPSNREIEEYIASEKTIRDLSIRLSDRIGIPVVFETDRTKKYKGKIKNDTAYVNLAYATLDTPMHEILGHPIIRAIKNGIDIKYTEYLEESDADEILEPGQFIKKNNLIYNYELDDPDGNRLFRYDHSKNIGQSNQLYQNLIKELEYGKGKEVLDRVKTNYSYKNSFRSFAVYDFESQQDAKEAGATFYSTTEDGEAEYRVYDKYSLEEQQEEAIVELLGLMTAEKLDNVKDGKLISLLKRLLKEMKSFMKSLLKQREVEIDKLPDNMTLGDLSDLLAYSNSKLILPGYEVEYTTPDNMKFKTYQEASNHISKLAKNVKDVDLSNLSINTEKGYEVVNTKTFERKEFVTKEEAESYKNTNEDFTILEYDKNPDIGIFIEKNKEYEQSKEIIEEWKKVNNIQYNPEEVYSRGQEFSSVVGAYSNFDVNLMMQNLLSHIEDNQKAGGKFAISAFTKPVDKQIGHLEGGGGKIKFKIYPKSEDILWASTKDVYSGSVWDASEKVNKDKKSELLGVSYTKYPSLNNVESVQPNLANIIDNRDHHHNELGIVLNFSNFEIEVDEDVPYTTKKIIENINKILQQKRLEEINNFINKLEKEC